MDHNWSTACPVCSGEGKINWIDKIKGNCLKLPIGYSFENISDIWTKTSDEEWRCEWNEK